MRRNALVAAILALVMVGCPGCWDKVELEDIAWVQAIGFDKREDGYLSITFEIGVPRGFNKGGMDGGGQGAPRYIVPTVVSRGLGEAMDIMATAVGRRLSLHHTQMVLFGEDLAKSDIRGVMASLDRSRELRRSILVAVCRGRAEDVLRVTMSPLEISPSRFIQTILQQHPMTGLFEAARFSSFMAALESGAITPSCALIAITRELAGGAGTQASGGSVEQQYPPIPPVGERMMEPALPPGYQSSDWTTALLEAGKVPYIGGGPVAAMGTAVFSGGKMVGVLSGDETSAMLMVRGDFERGGFSIADPEKPDQPEYSMNLELFGTKPRIQVHRSGDSIQIDVKIGVTISGISWRTQTDYTDPRMESVVEQAVAAYLKKVLDQAIFRTQKEMKADAFGFGNKVRKTFATWDEFDRFAWLAKYPEAEIRTAVDARLVRYGLDLAPPRIPPGELILKQQNP